MKKLFNLIFAKEEVKQHQPHDTKRASSEKQWAKFDAYMRSRISEGK
ncbi:hypothetical protein Javan425_0051 [Streptococcus phage Javan425]|uniref:Phage protein n=1 Tax=Streptococcus porcinus str. Jelinkova 176 TaxID=873448 RepID=A0ABN0CVN7_STRPO|nr:hypothetical protein [Streptococcus porcinus]EGJ27285.1 hypothetical protein STRPO_0252 [Streptococcus porcinus str. Jelinkova 176]QBX18354.1 hypothetical protein Javan423_0008 [Streptococcus phage Javan423]QBX18456.1 hypothetical protein Javan425_0051 [Streptococcus phage Javan425]SQG43931.1 phage protein [Streptococcus porcinus]